MTTSSPPKPRCPATRNNGQPCRNPVLLENGYCTAHTPNLDDPRRLVPGRQPGAGRKPLPRPDDERVRATIQKAQQNAGKALAVILDILADPDTRPDTRLRAAELLLDRGLGKALQQSTVEMSGSLSLEELLAVGPATHTNTLLPETGDA